MIYLKAFLLIAALATAAAVLLAMVVLVVIAVIPVDGPPLQTIPAPTQTPAATRQ